MPPSPITRRCPLHLRASLLLLSLLLSSCRLCSSSSSPSPAVSSSPLASTAPAGLIPPPAGRTLLVDVLLDDGFSLPVHSEWMLTIRRASTAAISELCPHAPRPAIEAVRLRPDLVQYVNETAYVVVDMRRRTLEGCMHAPRGRTTGDADGEDFASDSSSSNMPWVDGTAPLYIYIALNGIPLCPGTKGEKDARRSDVFWLVGLYRVPRDP